MKNSELLKNIITKYNTNPPDLDVYVVADVHYKTVNESDYRICHASENEFFSRREFADIASAIFYVFGYVKIFYSEIELIEYFLKNDINFNNCFVYNFSRDGIYQGKKALIPSFCNLYNIRYTGSDPFVISLLRNKLVFTEILDYHNIPVPKTMLLNNYNKIKESLIEFENKEIIIKNIYESASLGLSKQCRLLYSNQKYDELISIINSINTEKVLIQEYIDGIECEVFVIQYNKTYYAFNPIIINFPDGISFMDTTTSNTYNYGFSLLNDSELVEMISSISIKIAQILNIKDYARLDFKIKKGIPYIFDIAGTPYTIRHSSIAFLFEKMGLKYEDIYKIIAMCMLSNYNSLNK